MEVLLRDLKLGLYSYRLLIGSKFMFIYDRGNAEYDYIEVVFDTSNFMHLTGVISNLSANSFYSKLEDNKLKKKDIAYDSDGYTKLKLSVIGQISKVISVNTIFGDSNGSRVDISGTHFLGTKSKDFTISLFKRANNDYFFPQSLLRSNVVSDVVIPYDVICVLQKPHEVSEYNNVKHRTKITLDKTRFNTEIKTKISQSLYKTIY